MPFLDVVYSYIQKLYGYYEKIIYFMKDTKNPNTFTGSYYPVIDALEQNALCEARTHDLQIMRLTR